MHIDHMFFFIYFEREGERERARMYQSEREKNKLLVKTAQKAARKIACVRSCVSHKS